MFFKRQKFGIIWEVGHYGDWAKWLIEKNGSVIIVTLLILITLNLSGIYDGFNLI